MAVRREKGEGTVFQRQNNKKWVAKIIINGKPKSRTCDTKKDAMKALRELRKLKADEERRLTLNFDDYTVAQYFDLFLEYKKNQLGFDATSYRRLESTINTHIKPFFEFIPIKDLTGDLIQQRLTEAKESGKRNGQGLSFSSVKKIHDAFSSCIEFAIKIKKDIRPEDNPMFMVQMIPKKDFKEERTEVRYLVNEENNNERERFVKEALRKYSTGNYVYKLGPALVFMMNTGLREGEMCALARTDVNLKDKTVYVHNNVKVIKDEDGAWKTILVTEDAKYNSIRYVPLNARAIEMAELMMKLYPAIDEIDRLIYTRNKTLFPPLELNKTFKRICIGAEIEDMDGVGPHCLRHTFATSLFEQNVKVPVVSELLGHSSVEVTQNTYISITQRLKTKAMNLVNI